MANRSYGISSGTLGRLRRLTLNPVPPTVRVLGLVFVLSHLFFMEIAGLAYVYLPHAWAETPPGVLPGTSALAYRGLVRLWSHWDGQWYLTIAQHGYRVQVPQSTAFFPLYPVLVRYLGDGSTLGAVLISWAAMAGATWMLYKLARLDFGERVAWFTVLAISFFPTTFYTQAAYSESLFLLLAISSAYFMRTQRYWMSAVLGALTLTVSVYGGLLAVPLLWIIWRDKSPRRLRNFAPILLMPVGILLYMAFLTLHFHDPLIFEAAQSDWSRQPQFFGLTLWQGLVTAYQAAGQALSPAALFASGQPLLTIMNFYNFLFALYAIVVLIVTARWIPTYLWLYGGLALLLPLTDPAKGTPLMSLPRLLFEAFPVFIATGIMLERYPRVRVPYFVVSLVLAALFVSLFATSHWVA